MPSVAFHTLGCKLNYAETGALERAFQMRAYDIVDFGSPADVTVINTCSVTLEAERKCRQAVRRAVRANGDGFVIVTGCYAQLRPDDLASIPGVDLVLGAQEKPELFRFAGDFAKPERTQVEVSCIDHAHTFGPAYAAGSRTRAFLKVQDGCDYSCSFCTIPRARGRSRSQSIEGAVRQAEAIAEAGYREVVLSGVNIGLFGQDNASSLPDLIRALDAVEGIARYRISSIEPNLLTDEVIDLVATSRAFQPHFHVPLQSGSDAILAAMRRRYRAPVFADRVTRIQSVLPDACIGADVIVGFPGETDAQFAETAAFLSGLPLSYLHVFTYSERPDTAAVSMDRPSVPVSDRRRRNRQLRLVSGVMETAFLDRFVGSTRTVLWETGDPDGTLLGHTGEYVRVRRPHDPGRERTLESIVLDHVGADGCMVPADRDFIRLV